MSDVDSPKVLWESIKARYGGADRVKEARLQTLNSEFDRLKMHETETIDVFAGIASKSASLGETIDEVKLVKKLLKLVPRKFIHLVASLEQVLDLKKVGFEDVVGRLKAYEERVRGEDGGDEQKMVMFTRGGDGSFNGGRNNDGGDGFSGSVSRGLKEKGKVGSNNKKEGFINKDGSGSGCSSSGSGLKAQSVNKPTSYKPKQSNNQKTIGSNQVQENAELDWNQRHLYKDLEIRG